jgi:signal transduction histidine kinase
MKRFGLASRLSLLILLSTMGSAAAIGILGALVSSRFLMRSTQEGLSSLVRAYADAITLYFDGARSMLEATAPELAPAVDESTSGTLAKTARARMLARQLMSASPAFEYVLLTDSNGKILLVEPPSLAIGLSPPDVAFAAWFRDLRDRRTTIVSNLWVSTATHLPSVVIAVPLISRAGTLRGAWVGGLTLSRLSALAHADKGEAADTYGFVTDPRGLIAAHQARPDLVLAQTDYSGVAPVQEAANGRTGTMVYVSPIDGLSKLGAFIPLRLGGDRDVHPWTVIYATRSSAALQPVRTIAWMLVTLALVMGVALVVVSALIIRRTLNPVKPLADAAREMGRGNLAARAPTGMRFELAELAESFNQMAASISVSQETLKERALSLEQSNVQLEAANRELESFSYSVSHDLRAPLRSVDGFSKAILEDYSDRLDEEGKEYLRFLRQAAQKMGLLIDDMLTLSRATRGDLLREDVDLSAAAREIGDELASQEPDRRIRFDVERGLTARGDPRLLRSVVQNLMENAWKFTRGRDPAVIEFGSREQDGSRHFFVRDNGVGFDMKYVDKLFQPFQRLHRTQDYEGTGIGLATVKRILARHGGRAWVSSELEKGTTFYFNLGEGRH